jgi:hypothetical protein
MVAILRGVVKDGKIIPEKPLPEGEVVAIRLLNQVDDETLEKELLEEFEAWSHASNASFFEFEALLDQEETHAKS